MNARISRWGNSLALRLPRAAVERARVREGTALVLDAEEGRIVLRTVHRYRLADLLAEIHPGNLHGEVSVGQRRGREAW